VILTTLVARYRETPWFQQGHEGAPGREDVP
jgi:hypothetical protein